MSSIPIGAVIIEGITFIIGAIIVFYLVKRYVLKKSNITLLLLLSFSWYLFGILSIFLGRFAVYLYEIENYYTHPFAVFGILCSVIGNFFIIAFLQQLFFRNNKSILLMVSFFLGLSFGSMLVQLIIYPIYEQGSGHEAAMGVIVNGIYGVISIICCGLTFFYAFRAAYREKNVLRKVSAQFIGYYGLINIISFIFVVLDVFYSKNFGDYTIYYFIGHSFLLISAPFAFIGYFQPSWFKKLFDHKKIQKV